MSKELKEALEGAKAKLQQQDEVLKKLGDAAHQVGTVTEVRGDRMTVAVGSTLYDVTYAAPAVAGDTTLLLEETKQCIGVIHNEVPGGIVATVSRCQPGHVEVDMDGTPRTVRTARECAVGERLILDATLSSVIGSLGQPESKMAYSPDLAVTWDDIGGQVEAKRQLIDAIETPYKNAKLFAKYGRRPKKGVLLYGPPGNGKTLLAKAVATSVARTHGHDRAEGFTLVNGPELLSKWVGQSEANIREIFESGERHMARYGYPMPVFIDEADSLLGTRGKDDVGSGIRSTVVPQFLSLMDGVKGSAVIIILATNRPGDLDPAVVREGRIDAKVLVGRPNRKDAEDIIRIHMRNRPAREDLAPWVASKVFDPSIVIKTFDTKLGTLSMQLQHAVSGAMLFALTEQASEQAMARDIESNCVDACAGLLQEDFAVAIERTVQALRVTDTNDVMREIFDARKAAGNVQAT